MKWTRPSAASTDAVTVAALAAHMDEAEADAAHQRAPGHGFRHRQGPGEREEQNGLEAEIGRPEQREELEEAAHFGAVRKGLAASLLGHFLHHRLFSKDNFLDRTYSPGFFNF